MHYPFFDVPQIGGGLLIAIVAILHVVVAHFAVGAGLFIAVAHTLAHRRDDTLVLRFLRDNSRFLVLLAFIFGAVSGVGIWFTIAVVSPRATSILIHNFVWGWAIEWVLFAVEIVAGYCYYYGWDRLTPSRHMAVAWIYAIASYGSLVVINGILTFMLTPGDWSTAIGAKRYDAAFWSGFFNPTYFPSLMLRSLSALALAGLFACVVVNLSNRYTREERTRIINYAAYCLAPMVLMAPTSLWYFNHVPEASRIMAAGGAIAMTLFLAFGIVCSLMIGAYAYFALIRKKQYVSLSTSLLLTAMALVTTGAMEFVREGIRKPYVIRDYLWSNGIADREAEYMPIAVGGALSNAPWIVGDTNLATAGRKKRGELIFRAQCAACHTHDGANGIKHLVAYSRDIIRDDIEHLHERKNFMPPFLGTAKDKEDLAAYLFSLNNIAPKPRPGVERDGAQTMTRFRLAILIVLAIIIESSAVLGQDDLNPVGVIVRHDDSAQLVASQPATSQGSLIPPKDEFGLPGPVWLFEFLLPATFFLHVLFMNIALGTALLAIPLTLMARRRPHVHAALHDLYAGWPVAMSLTVTTGIAPLLFVQVLYGHFFFVSSILLGWWWLAILIALLAAFYGIYIAKAAVGHGTDPRQQADRPPSLLHWLALTIIALACIFIAAMFTANSTLMLLPDAWKQVHEGRQFGWAVHPMFWPRLAHNLIGSLAVTGMFIAVRARLRGVDTEQLRKHDTFYLLSNVDGHGPERMDADAIVKRWNETRVKMISLGLLIALVATCVQVADGVWFVITIFHDVVAAFHQVTPGTILWGLAALTAIALIVALFKGLDHPERPSAVWLPAGLLAFILVGMSAGRERVRMGLLQRHAEKLYTEADVRPQTLTTILFFITLAAGLALIAIMARWMFTARRNEANLPS